MKGGDVRAILKIAPINFGLKSQEEQDAITYAFQNFLNSLDFDVQVLIHSQKMNIDPYMEGLKHRSEEEENDLLREQINEYIEFIKSFVSTTNIMTKEFYLVIPFALYKAQQQSAGVLKTLSTFFPQKTGFVQMTEAQFGAAKTQLWQRVEFIVQNLAQMGLTTRTLETEEIAHLLWRMYNPEQQAAGTLPQIPEELAK